MHAKFPNAVVKLSDLLPIEAADEVNACFATVEHVLTTTVPRYDHD
jgi:hypothetical protein